MNNKRVYLLIGQKGSGKSFIGKLMENEFEIKFIRVEDWVKEIRNGRQIDNESYLKEVFQIIEKGVRETLDQYNKIVFESTGTTKYFDQMLISLRNDFSIVTIGVHADSITCLNRVKARDQIIHINVSDEQVNIINKQVREKQITTDYVLDNESKSRNELTMELSGILNETI